MERRRFLQLLAGAGTFVAVGAACSDDGNEVADTAPPGATEPTDAAPAVLPNNDKAELRAIFDPIYAPLGLAVTRIGLFDLDGGYVPDDAGTHLAIYVQPIDDAEWTIDRYVEMLVPGTAVAAPFVFAEWSGLQTMDVCQEPPQAEAPEEVPLVVTQVVLSRADSALIPWDTATLADLLAAALRSPDSARVVGRPDVEATDAWMAAQQAAIALV